MEIDESKMCPLAAFYDADIHDGLANMRRLDGSLPKHDKYGPSVIVFAPTGRSKCWIKATTPVLG